ncbi:hypothetical protein [Legionella cherrii]|uniref:Uncharacterized protein n=1 Tax=Legionella cherrii TaxID=28084 RepID=A0A0W0SBS3_9GAMM|nr:hypothetical protein [Legionella cherrii]KTC81004.1 hypothetical protein Lche_3024 [Legionella cherrii]VEB33863.1 Uncharacterised protein [Legionella cherrii]
MFHKILQATFAILCFSLGWSAQAAQDLMIINSSDQIAEARVFNYDCLDTDSCSIAPGTSISISQATMNSLCIESPEKCEIKLGVAPIIAAIGVGVYHTEQGLLYVAGSRWTGYSARQLASNVIEIYKTNKIDEVH